VRLVRLLEGLDVGRVCRGRVVPWPEHVATPDSYRTRGRGGGEERGTGNWTAGRVVVWRGDLVARLQPATTEREARVQISASDLRALTVKHERIQSCAQHSNSSRS
jgi:hypothetical protein